MGIKDLLRFMKPYIEPIHIKKYAGERVKWASTRIVGSTEEVTFQLLHYCNVFFLRCWEEGDKKWRYIDYCMHRINLLRHYKIVPVVVFDGGNLPCKAVTQQERHRKKEKNRELAMEKLKEGNINAASELFQRAVNITPSIANQLIKLLREHNIEFVVAPYEADAQLAYLSSLGTQNGGIAAVITEDSDMIAYGCKATIFKMDRYGNGEEMMLDKIFNSASCTPSFRDFDKELLTGMCVLAGCDFLPSVPGIGIARAYALVSKHRNLEHALSALKLQKKEKMPEDYFKLFRQAMAVFQHAQIYDAETRKLIPMKPLPLELLQALDEEIDFLGPDMPPSIAVSIAEGRLNPVTMEAFSYFSSEECSQDLIIKNNETLPRTEKAEVSGKESCFMVVGKDRERHIPDKRIKPVAGYKNSKEEFALEKLITPSSVPRTNEDKPVLGYKSIKTPDNNPFKRRKVDELPLDLAQRVDEEVSVVSEDECALLSCATSDNLISKSSNKRKLNEALTGQKDNATEHISGVTQEEDSVLLELPPESQKSITAKASSVIGRKRVVGKENKNFY
ncbi:exonuclease 1 [Cucumis melo var. makuwa]|uniref:Exonuclease 1 n=1 Tax=Cucumis melo var. makuwa TaxID=1194695 RepID=A0A5D3BIB4_CUCMM|nr:exonuclease 1 [Cucumis melo var. makuwa]